MVADDVGHYFGSRRREKDREEGFLVGMTVIRKSWKCIGSAHQAKKISKNKIYFLCWHLFPGEEKLVPVISSQQLSLWPVPKMVDIGGESPSSFDAHG